MSTPPRAESILVIGAGELGLAIINAILSHPLYSPTTTHVTLMIRPSSLSQPSPEKASQNKSLVAQGVSLVGGDIESLALPALTSLLQDGEYTAVLHAGGMTLAAGTMLKLTRAALAAENVRYYVPWQHGVDYDIIGREGGQGMFSEQIEVRELLRAQHSTDWVIVSCGIFMSFLFEEFWGVVARRKTSREHGEGEGQASARETVQVTALNSWDDLITTTTAADIGTCTAELLFSSDAPVNQPVYIAGDTLTYGAFADTIERVLEPKGVEIVRREWPLSYLRQESEKDPEDKLKKYRVVFSEGRGLSWPKEGTWSDKMGIKMMGVEEYVRKNWA